ncbi:DUF493 family protein YbeD [Candidatus Fukatsuia anoeciicola]|uniref:DUF493 family protein YbeD n=1 Tax=Candidatus Fukatsuia anoeciicola TaxID=2994492 RepID=UPI0034640D76
MKNKLGKLLRFPCFFTYKVIGFADDQFIDKILAVVQRHIPGDYMPKIKSSNKNNYNSVSITITATCIKQIEMLYHELGKLPLVRIVL